ncbi:50S ribosomal protein L6 [Desulfofustis glycolicus]|uniref:Large ribosomal subunit protein uL6 n=1 Tax=Desulfofustis glycolicus DSM 9705 TaxID=1121409 RepID=A0A1M5Y4W3_9BACT|nr:50S ribosomal protein L6 [Desulfofustis glycolicus]MCB2215043.1 50S ribosomal protein L6 [Desulfobulbaceae bacterium]SHI07042.1 LSU ribosomal protein L6P [Desulfofustis glycolicus DSM 9705]
MSRIGKMPIPVPAGVTVEIKGQDISVSGKKGTLNRTVHPEVSLVLEDGAILVDGKQKSRNISAFRGLTRSLVNNMVVGVAEGFKKVLVVEGVGYRASMAGNNLSLSVGYSNPVEFALPEGVTGNIEGNTKIVLESIDKETLGLTAAKIRAIRKPEPYKGKGIRYEDERIVRKAGKTGAK